MNNKILIAILGVAIAGSLIFAFTSCGMVSHLDHKGKAPQVSMSNDLVSRLTQKLALTTDQQGQAREVVDGIQAKAAKIRADEKLTREQKLAKGQELMAEAHTNIAKFLSPEQVKKYDALVAEMHGAQQGEKGH